MRGVHVHQHEPALRLREDVDAVQLRDGKSERMLARSGLRLRGRTHVFHSDLRGVRRGLRGRKVANTGSESRVEIERRSPARRLARKTRHGESRGRNRGGGRLHGPRLGERPLKGTEQEIVHESRFAKPHLEFLRVRVHVHARRIHLEIKDVGRLPAVIEHVAIGEPHRARDQLVPQRPPVQVEMLLVRLAACIRRHAEPAAQREAGALVIELHRVGDEFVAEHCGHACVTSPFVECRRMIGERASRGQKAEADVEPAEREPLDQALDLRQLGALGTQELAPRRER